jgi:hypothetical protein
MESLISDPSNRGFRCVCCDSSNLELAPLLWPRLIQEWQLSDEEAAYIDRQQALRCRACACNLRSMALAMAILRCYGHKGSFRRFTSSFRARGYKVLEINEAGGLTQYLKRMPGHVLQSYPAIDMANIQFPDKSFDLVVHSDTLEHVGDPVKGLRECHRVLKPGGFCAFTVPMVVGRLTVSRTGHPHSYHGSVDQRSPDLLVQTEYGADAWKQVLQAGFPECRVVSLEYPTALALVGVKGR